MRFFKDGNGSLCVEFEQAFGHCKRAWIQRKRDPAKDWAQSPERRYLNVVRVAKESGNPSGNATDFPIFNALSDREILENFVTSVCTITGVDPGPISST
jgi:hypothetical protein